MSSDNGGKKVETLLDSEIWQDFFLRARTLASKEELLSFYAKWASHFEDAIGRIGDYASPHRLAQIVASSVGDRGVEILDVACGTGLVGAALSSFGFDRIDGVDLSQEMLAQAEAKGCYRSLVVADVGKPHYAPAHSYSVIVCAGAFTGGHLSGDVLENLLSALAPGGLFVADVDPESWEGIHEALNKLEAQGVLAKHSRQPGHFFTPDAGDSPDAWFVEARKSDPAIGDEAAIPETPKGDAYPGSPI
jgi:SAM-dependent methyltransferase